MHVVLDVVIAQYLSQYDLNISYRKYLSYFVSNKSLEYLMKQKFLCSPIVSVVDKACADRFEAIIGCMYYYLYDIQNTDDAIVNIAIWYDKTFDINTLFQNAMSIMFGKNMDPEIYKFKYNEKFTVTFPYQTNNRHITNIIKNLAIDLPGSEKIPIEFSEIAYRQFDSKVATALVNKYGFSSNHMFVFLGSIIFKLLLTNEVIDLIGNYQIKTSYQAHILREKLSDPSLLLILAKTIGSNNVEIVYAFLGLMYYYFYVFEKSPTAFQRIDSWFIKSWLPILKNTQIPVVFPNPMK